jgi:glycogen(starch) synthase
LKILIYSHFFLPSVGGVERLVDSLARGFTEKGNQVCVATATAAETFDDHDLPFSVVRRPGVAALLRLIRRHDVAHLAGPALLPAFLGYVLRKPVVVEHHMYQAVCPNGLLVYQPDRTVCPGHFLAGRHTECLRCNAGQGRWSSLRMWLLAFPRLWLCRRAAANIAVTEHVGRRLHLSHCRRIYHGTAVVPLAGPRTAVEGRRAAPVCFAYIGRFVSEKGLPLLIDAAARLKRDGLPFRLKFIGDGPERTNLEAAARIHDLQDRTFFTGMLGPEDLRKETADVMAVVMPSIWEETAGMAAIEQMMRGRAVVAADIGGLGEVVDGAGLKFPPGNAQALAECMRRLIDDPDLARRLGASARQRALALFPRDAMMEAHLQLYQEFPRGVHGSPGPAVPVEREAGK